MEFMAVKLFLFINLNNDKIPLMRNAEELLCTTCLLPMQYQKKIDNVFLWQCFKCGKKYFVSNTSDIYTVMETWSSS
jgi:hypothetical protein